MEKSDVLAIESLWRSVPELWCCSLSFTLQPLGGVLPVMLETAGGVWLTQTAGSCDMRDLEACCVSPAIIHSVAHTPRCNVSLVRGTVIL